MGSSASSTAGPGPRAIAIIARWRCPPERRCGWSSRVTPTSARAAAARRRGLAARQRLVRAQGLGHLPAHPAHRVQGRRRVLRHQGDARPAHRPHRVGTEPQQLAALQRHAALDEARGAGHEVDERQGGERLPRAALPHQAQRLAGAQVERHAVHQRHRALGPRGGHPQPAGAEQRRRRPHGAHRRRARTGSPAGSSTSRRASPTRLTASTVRTHHPRREEGEPGAVLDRVLGADHEAPPRGVAGRGRCPGTGTRGRSRRGWRRPRPARRRRRSPARRRAAGGGPPMRHDPAPAARAACT